MLSQGQQLPTTEPIKVRVDRCKALLGVDVSQADAAKYLEAHEVKVEKVGENVLKCEPPAFRPDLEREIDLIEEIARTVGYSTIPERDTIDVRVRHPQESERARRELHRVLTGPRVLRDRDVQLRLAGSGDALDRAES